MQIILHFCRRFVKSTRRDLTDEGIGVSTSALVVIHRQGVARFDVARVSVNPGSPHRGGGPLLVRAGRGPAEIVGQLPLIRLPRPWPRPAGFCASPA